MANKSFEETVLGELKGLVQRMDGLEQGQNGLQEGQRGLVQRMDGLEKDISYIGALQEEMRDDSKTILEGISVINKQLDDKADQHSVDKLAADVSTIRKAVRATNLDLRHISS